MQKLEYLLGVKREYLRSLLECRATLYRQHIVPKKLHPYPGKARLAKQGAEVIKYRTINNPQDQLKGIQRLILRRVLSQVELPFYMFGAVKGKTLGAHARAHSKNQQTTLVKLDIKDYFPSITCNQVYGVWRNVLGCPPKVASLLTALTTVEWHLPQGAPTSPAIANIFLASIFEPVCIEAGRLGLTISAYMDDLSFSGPAARDIMTMVRQILEKNGLKLANSKRQILGPSATKPVTGVRLGRFGPRAPRRKLSELRTAIFKLGGGLIPQSEEERYVGNLRGRLAHITMLCPKDAIKLKAQLNLAQPKYTQKMPSTSSAK